MSDREIARARALVVDGKLAPYLAGDMKFTGDSKHLFSQRGVPGQGAAEVLIDGTPFMRAAGVQLYMAPTGPAVLGDVLTIADPALSMPLRSKARTA